MPHSDVAPMNVVPIYIVARIIAVMFFYAHSPRGDTGCQRAVSSSTPGFLDAPCCERSLTSALERSDL